MNLLLLWLSVDAASKSRSCGDVDFVLLEIEGEDVPLDCDWDSELVRTIDEHSTALGGIDMNVVASLDQLDHGKQRIAEGLAQDHLRYDEVHSLVHRNVSIAVEPRNDWLTEGATNQDRFLERQEATEEIAARSEIDLGASVHDDAVVADCL